MATPSFEWPRNYALTSNMATISLNWPGDKNSENQITKLKKIDVDEQTSYKSSFRRYESLLRIPWYIRTISHQRREVWSNPVGDLVFFCPKLRGRAASHFIFPNSSFLTDFREQLRYLKTTGLAEIISSGPGFQFLKSLPPRHKPSPGGLKATSYPKHSTLCFFSIGL